MDIISVVIPVYNSAKYLRECVESVLGQSYAGLDVILVDDGSTDESPAICAEYAARDSRVRFFEPGAIGVGAARNYGIDRARGKYLMFADSDDVCEAGLAERLIRGRAPAAGEPGTGEAAPQGNRLVLCGITVTDAEGTETGAFREEAVTGTVPVREYARKVLAKWQNNPLCGGVYCKLFETETLKQHNIRFEEKETYAEDFLFNLAYLKHTEEVTILPEALYRYRMGRSGSLTEGNMKTADPEAVWARRKQVIRAYTEVFEGLGLAEECAGEIRAFRLKNVTDIVEMAVKQGAKGAAFARWMAAARGDVGEDFSGVPGKYRVTLRLMKKGRYRLLRGYEMARREVRKIRGRER